MKEITLRSHAKINLSLRVSGRRPDGYHEIVSFMQGTDLCDVVTVKECSQNGTKYNLPHCRINDIVVYLCTDTDTIPADATNLAFKGVSAFCDACRNNGTDPKHLLSGLMIVLEKRLPVAAGIAGGSGNAAVCMLGLNAILNYPLTLRQLMDAGVSAGADVPFSIFMNAFRNSDKLAGLGGIEESSDAAWVSGIGETVKAAAPFPAHVVLANPGISVSTQAAYEAMDRIGYSNVSFAEELFVNDMEKYTLSEEPRAYGLKALMSEKLGADAVLMSGSGPTIAAYYKDEKKAEAGMKLLSELVSADESTRIWISATGLKI